MQESIIQASQLSYQSGRRYLLSHINWQVARGEHWCVFGANGCGKTTLLSIIAGFRQPTAGTVRVFNEAFTAANVRALRRRIGWVSSSFFDHYFHQESALAIVLSGKTAGFGLDATITEADVKRAKSLLAQWRLADKRNYPFAMLSKGERQNVLLARAFLSQPELLILDEPCSGLDVIARKQLLDTVDGLAQEGAVTIIYVTHYAEEILPAFAHTLMLGDGRVYAQGETEALLQAEVLSDFFAHPVTVRQDADGRRSIVPLPLSRLPQEGGALR